MAAPPNRQPNGHGGNAVTQETASGEDPVAPPAQTRWAAELGRGGRGRSRTNRSNQPRTSTTERRPDRQNPTRTAGAPTGFRIDPHRAQEARTTFRTDHQIQQNRHPQFQINRESVTGRTPAQVSRRSGLPGPSEPSVIPILFRDDNALNLPRNRQERERDTVGTWRNGVFTDLGSVERSLPRLDERTAEEDEEDDSESSDDEDGHAILVDKHGQPQGSSQGLERRPSAGGTGTRGARRGRRNAGRSSSGRTGGRETSGREGRRRGADDTNRDRSEDSRGGREDTVAYPVEMTESGESGEETDGEADEEDWEEGDESEDIGDENHSNEDQDEGDGDESEDEDHECPRQRYRRNRTELATVQQQLAECRAERSGERRRSGVPEEAQEQIDTLTGELNDCRTVREGLARDCQRLEREREDRDRQLADRSAQLEDLREEFNGLNDRFQRAVRGIDELTNENQALRTGHPNPEEVARAASVNYERSNPESLRQRITRLQEVRNMLRTERNNVNDQAMIEGSRGWIAEHLAQISAEFLNDYYSGEVNTKQEELDAIRIRLEECESHRRRPEDEFNEDAHRLAGEAFISTFSDLRQWCVDNCCPLGNREDIGAERQRLGLLAQMQMAPDIALDVNQHLLYHLWANIEDADWQLITLYAICCAYVSNYMFKDPWFMLKSHLSLNGVDITAMNQAAALETYHQYAQTDPLNGIRWRCMTASALWNSNFFSDAYKADMYGGYAEDLYKHISPFLREDYDTVHALLIPITQNFAGLAMRIHSAPIQLHIKTFPALSQSLYSANHPRMRPCEEMRMQDNDHSRDNERILMITQPLFDYTPIVNGTLAPNPIVFCRAKVLPNTPGRARNCPDPCGTDHLSVFMRSRAPGSSADLTGSRGRGTGGTGLDAAAGAEGEGETGGGRETGGGGGGGGNGTGSTGGDVPGGAGTGVETGTGGVGTGGSDI